MAIAIIVGTVIYLIIFGVTAYFVTDKVTRETEDEKTK